MTTLTDVEVSRALNALATTLKDQRPERFDAARVEQIVLGALAQERKLAVVSTSRVAGVVRHAVDGRLVATVELRDGSWVVERRLDAGQSSWALPQPAHDRAASADG
jgi:hypothetical protein